MQRDAPVPSGTRPPDADLLRRLEECLAFAQRTIERADPHQEPWRSRGDGVEPFDKMLMEAALLAFVAHRRGRSTDLARSVIAAVRDRHDATTHLLDLMRLPGRVTTSGTTLLILDRFGLTSDQEHRVLARCLASPHSQAEERTPFRLMDRQWQRHVAGVGRLVDDSTVRLSAPCRTAHPIYMSRGDGYALTHAIFYATDFGLTSPPAAYLDPSVLHTLDAGIAWCSGAADFDLLAELVLSQIYLLGSVTPYGRIALHMSFRTWDVLGFLPSPSLSASDYRELETDSEREQYAFHHMYHTVFVAGLACVALLDSRDGPPPDDPVVEDPAEADRAILATCVREAEGFVARTLGMDESRARALIRDLAWEADLARLEELEELFGSADPLLSADPTSDTHRMMARDAFVIEAARSYDLAGVAGGLRRAAGPGARRPAGPTAWTAARFLADQFGIDGAVGPALGRPADEMGRARLVQVTAALAQAVGLVLDDHRDGVLVGSTPHDRTAT